MKTPVLDPRVRRLQAAVDVAAERNQSNEAALRQDRDDKVVGAPRPSGRDSSSYAAPTQTPPARGARLGRRPSAGHNPPCCHASPDNNRSTDIVLDAPQHDQDVRRGRGGTGRGGRGGGRIGVSAPAPARPPDSVPRAHQHSAEAISSLHAVGSAQQERVGAGGNVPEVGWDRAEATPAVGLEGGGCKSRWRWSPHGARADARRAARTERQSCDSRGGCYGRGSGR